MIEIEMLNFINCIFLNVEYKKSSFVHLRAQIKWKKKDLWCINWL